jgi:site-specific recombinase XerD
MPMMLPDTANRGLRGFRSKPSEQGSVLQNSLDKLVNIIRNYSALISYDEIFTIDQVTQVFVDMTECPGAFLDYRGAINHLMRYLKFHRHDISHLNQAIVQDFRDHVCSAACLPSKAFKGRLKIVAISRFILFLQYQGVIESHGWSSTDAQTCLDFRHVLLTEGLGIDRANVQARLAIHFVIWLRLCGTHRDDISEETVTEFVAHQCMCGVNATMHVDAQVKARRRVAIQRFTRFLKSQDVVLRGNALISEHKVSLISPGVLQYQQWLLQKGISIRTAYYYVRDLTSWLPKLGEDASTYSAKTIRDLALSEFRERSPAMQGRFIRSVRSYVEFRASEGDCSPALMHALVSRPTYRLSSVPRRLEPGVIPLIIESCDPAKPSGIRDRAIITLLSELGLRAVEVWRLKVSDLDWEEAKIRIHGKGGRGSMVPLPQRSGDAILDYLETSRQLSQFESLFLRVSRPHVPLANAAEISGIARKALARCGHSGGAHVFRHTLATELLRDGRSLGDVATVLRHKSLDSTAIYAKVNEPMLQQLANQWLGDVDD